jgi:uncharacterized membrane protein YdbT with pleckstrin-like domain
MVNKFFAIFWDTTGSFEGKEEGEQVVMLLRRHPFTILAKLALLFLAFILPFIVGFFAFPYLLAMGGVDLYIFISCVWCLAFWLVMFHALTMYALNVVIVTNKRILDSDQYALFNRRVAEVPLGRVQDISVHTHGLIETFLKFGDMVVQSAGSERQFIFPQIPRPDEVKNTIMKIVHQEHIIPNSNL